MALKDVELVAPAEVLLRIVHLVRTAASDDHRQWALSTLDHACRQLECFVKPEISVRASEEAANLSLNPLSSYTWHDQVSKMGDAGRKLFHWEHVLPVAEIKRRLLDPRTKTVEDVVAVIKLVDVAWILKEEDLKLTAQGFSHKRPADPWEAYVKAEIPMVRATKGKP